ncbi:hypothetical protein ACOQNQ_01840 [Pseudomonas juntendi]|uniref:hypothetical protein n=1 Tax=Pseudomonas juntendi TaxID=2666183 RepID=UPI003B95E228
MRDRISLAGLGDRARREINRPEGKIMSGTFEQGWAARPFAQQFPEMNADEAKRLDHINTSITTLYLAGLLTDKQANEIRTKKFPKVVTKAVLGKR